MKILQEGLDLVNSFINTSNKLVEQIHHVKMNQQLMAILKQANILDYFNENGFVLSNLCNYQITLTPSSITDSHKFYKTPSLIKMQPVYYRKNHGVPFEGIILIFPYFLLLLHGKVDDHGNIITQNELTPQDLIPMGYFDVIKPKQLTNQQSENLSVLYSSTADIPNPNYTPDTEEQPYKDVNTVLEDFMKQENNFSKTFDRLKMVLRPFLQNDEILQEVRPLVNQIAAIQTKFCCYLDELNSVLRIKPAESLLNIAKVLENKWFDIFRLILALLPTFLQFGEQILHVLPAMFRISLLSNNDISYPSMVNMIKLLFKATLHAYIYRPFVNNILDLFSFIENFNELKALSKMIGISVVAVEQLSFKFEKALELLEISSKLTVDPTNPSISEENRNIYVTGRYLIYKSALQLPNLELVTGYLFNDSLVLSEEGTVTQMFHLMNQKKPLSVLPIGPCSFQIFEQKSNTCLLLAQASSEIDRQTWVDHLQSIFDLCAQGNTQKKSYVSSPASSTKVEVNFHGSSIPTVWTLCFPGEKEKSEFLSVMEKTQSAYLYDKFIDITNSFSTDKSDLSVPSLPDSSDFTPEEYQLLLELHQAAIEECCLSFLGENSLEIVENSQVLLSSYNKELELLVVVNHKDKVQHLAVTPTNSFGSMKTASRERISRRLPGTLRALSTHRK